MHAASKVQGTKARDTKISQTSDRATAKRLIAAMEAFMATGSAEETVLAQQAA